MEAGRPSRDREELGPRTMLRASSLLSGTMRNVVGHLLARRTTAVARWGETAEKNQGNGEETAL
jgi:hypothetical protein